MDNAQKVMILGKSKDLGTCKSTKKNGEKCTAIVNINKCPFCIYHIKQEYQKCSQRSELQSSFAGRGLTALRNKVLGKNEVFYAGKSYTAIPAKRSKKLRDKDDGRLQLLSSLTANSNSLQKKVLPRKRLMAANLEVSANQRVRDLELLNKLSGSGTQSEFKASHSASVTLESSKIAAVNVVAKLKAKNVNNSQTDNSDILKKKQDSEEVENNKVSDDRLTETVKEVKTANGNEKVVASSAAMSIPKLTGFDKGTIDLTSISPRQKHKAKLNALKFVEKNGPLKKSDPNSIKKSPTSKKRLQDQVDKSVENEPKRKKNEENAFLSDRFKKMMEATSKHMDLLEHRDNEEKEKYFYKLEVREQMEEKMSSTYKMTCKAVKCLKCKYTSFSAAQKCKDEKHPLRVMDAMKRFFKCGNCGNRTVCLDIIPTVACKNCGSGKWERTGMIKEKVAVMTPNLSIRGGEQKFTNSVATNANVNLLVPDQD